MLSLPFFVYEFLVAFLLPPGLFFLLLFLLAWAVYGKRLSRTGASFILLLLAGSFYLLSCPAGERLLLAPLENQIKPIIPPVDEKGTAILVLGGGIRDDRNDEKSEPSARTLQRLVGARVLAVRTHWPIWVCGGRMKGQGEPSEARVMAKALEAMETPVPLFVEDRSRTTWENLLQVKGLFVKRHVSRVVLVTNAFHMPRALWAAHRFLPDTSIFPYPVGKLSDATPLSFWDFLPRTDALEGNLLAIHEWVGIAGYRLRALFQASPSS